MGQKKKWAIYIRVSTKEQAENPEGSLKSQQCRCADHLTNKYGKDVQYEIFCDPGCTGRNTNRPAFQLMIEKIKAKEITGIIATELARVSRDVVESNVLRNLCQNENIQLIFLAENIDVSPPWGTLVFNIFASFAQMESEKISYRVKQNAIARAKRGLYTGTKILGYSLGKETRGRLEINESEAFLVRLIFEKYLEIGSYYQTTAWLNIHGYRHRGKPWQNSAVERILKNIAYIAQRKYNDKIIDGVWEPIISKEQFAQVQEMLAINHVSRRNNIGTHNHTYIFSGLLYCTECKQLLTPGAGTGRHKKQYYYYKHKVQSPNCKIAKYLPADEIEKKLLEVIAKVINDDNLFALACSEWLTMHHQNEITQQQKINILKKTVDQIDTQAANLINSISMLTKEQVMAFVQPKINDLLLQKQQLIAELDESEKKLENLKKNIPDVNKLREIVGTFDNYLVVANKNLQKKAINLLIEKVELTADEIVCYVFDQKKSETGFNDLASCRPQTARKESKILKTFLIRIPFL